MKYLNTYKIYETLNSRGSKSLTESEFESILNQNCKIWLDGIDNKLYRSQRNMGSYVYTDARGTVRNSIERINLHIDLMDSLECWDEYPKYSEAIIGISDDPYVSYGSGDQIIYEVIPFDNAMIAVCPESDIWSSFSESGDFGEYIYIVNNFLNDIDISAFDIKKLKDINNIIEYCEDKGIAGISDGMLSYTEEILGKDANDITGDDVYNVIVNYMFNPDSRGFELHEYNKDFEIECEKQIWCNGPVLLLDKNLADEIHRERLKERNS